MGTGGSKEKALVDFPDGDKYFGLENFGNTCYCNSVLQSLYFCKPFREHLLNYASHVTKDNDENMLTSLTDLFNQINGQKRKTGVITPKKFIQRLRREDYQDDLFRSYMHQDAHEFLKFLLPKISELVKENEKNRLQKQGGPAAATIEPDKTKKTWVDELFQGKQVHETRCLQCENVTRQEEAFYDLILPIEQNCSVTHCLRTYSSTEMLDPENKFSCDNCGCLQEAQRRTKVKELPPVLCLHLKRFIQTENAMSFKKKKHRVVFPFELKLSTATDGCPAGDSLYKLFAIVVHVGSSLEHGHYVALVKSHSHWLLFDDENVEPVSEPAVQTTFGSTQDYTSQMDHAYLLLYERLSTGP